MLDQTQGVQHLDKLSRELVHDRRMGLFQQWRSTLDVVDRGRLRTKAGRENASADATIARP